uniref:7TM_GPCR_Srx domain-containing protein n=1 Tax=Steinernema glaseri TaxID=37863 RepID=A0A1I8AN06_9BILA
MLGFLAFIASLFLYFAGSSLKPFVSTYEQLMNRSRELCPADASCAHCRSSSDIQWSTDFLTKKQMDAVQPSPSSYVSDICIVGYTLLVSGILSLGVNSVVIHRINKTIACFGHPFGFLCMAQCAASCGTAFIFGFAISTITIVNSLPHESFWNARCGQFLVFFYFCGFFAHLGSAINRLCCIAYQCHYSKLFTATKVKFMIAMSWLVSFALVAHHFHGECSIYFDIQKLSVQFLETPCARISHHVDFYLSAFLGSVLLMVNVVTLYKIRCIRNTVGGTLAHRKKQKKDIRLSHQVTFQSLLLLIQLVVLFLVAITIENRWLTYVLSTLPRIVLQMIDGLIIVIMHKSGDRCARNSEDLGTFQTFASGSIHSKASGRRSLAGQL